jgi:hypothetical protein
MEKIYEVDLSNCAELTTAEWESRDIYRRFTEAVLAPPLTGRPARCCAGREPQPHSVGSTGTQPAAVAGHLRTSPSAPQAALAN